jgi:hypothetical protein
MELADFCRMAGAFASSGDRLGKRLDLKRLLQFGRRAKGSGIIFQGVTRREDQRNAAFHDDIGDRKAHYAVQVDVENGQIEQPD